MKKLFVLMSLALFLMATPAKAVNIDIQATVININGTVISRSSIKSIDYSSMNGATYIHLKDGTVLCFYTDYNEYSRIDHAYHTVTVASHVVITPYYGYYQPAYPVMPQPVLPPMGHDNHNPVQNQPSETNHGYNNSGVHQGSHTSYAVSGMPMAPATPAYSAGSFTPHQQGFSGGGAMMPQSRGISNGVPMGG